MHPDIVEMVRWIAGKGIEPCITTNGLLLTKEMSSRLKEAGLFSLDISLCGATKEVYEAAMVGANFEDLMRNIEDARLLDPKICVTITKDNVHQIDLFETLIKSLRFNGSLMVAVDTDDSPEVPESFSALEVAEVMRGLKTIAWDGTTSTLFDKECTGVIRGPFSTKIKYIAKEV
jgi:MoaA/NifB/PqqE/SkfB family radical SAM enzyme